MSKLNWKPCVGGSSSFKISAEGVKLIGKRNAKKITSAAEFMDVATKQLVKDIIKKLQKHVKELEKDVDIH